MNNLEKQRKYLKYLSAGGVLLELGCGAGDFLHICREAGVTAVGVDKNKKALCHKEFKVFNDDLIGFLKKGKASKYMNIYARHIVEHFYPGEIKNIFMNAYRILKKGGSFVMIFPNTRNINVSTHEFWKDETHARLYPGETLVRLLEEAGFKIIKNGPDKDSWDNSSLKNVIRFIRRVVSGIPSEPPDYFIVAEK